MDLKLGKITHDHVTKETVLEFVDVLDPFPIVTISSRIVTRPDETEAQIEADILKKAKEVLEAANLATSRATVGVTCEIKNLTLQADTEYGIR